MWIAKSIDGGVCVLSSRHRPIKGVFSLGVGCDRVASAGATVESGNPAESGTTVAGVVPSGVTSVVVTLANSATTTVPVTENAWALETAAAVSGTRDVEGN